MMEALNPMQGAPMQTTLGTRAPEPTFRSAMLAPQARRIDAGTPRTEAPARCGSRAASPLCALTGA